MQKKIKTVRHLTLTLDDGTDLAPAAYLGKGMFCSAWRDGESVYLLHDESKGDRGKSILEFINIYNDPPPKHIPPVELLGHIDPDIQVFKMPYYRPLKAAHTEAWADFKALHVAHETARREIQKELNSIHGPGAHFAHTIHSGYAINQGACMELEKARGKKHPLVHALRLLTGAAGDFGQENHFEFSKRNLAVGKEEELILLDCVFNLEEIHKRRKKVL